MALVTMLVKVELQVLIKVDEAETNYGVVEASRDALIKKVKGIDLHFGMREIKIIKGLDN